MTGPLDPMTTRQCVAVECCFYLLVLTGAGARVDEGGRVLDLRVHFTAQRTLGGQMSKLGPIVPSI